MQQCILLARFRDALLLSVSPNADCLLSLVFTLNWLSRGFKPTSKAHPVLLELIQHVNRRSWFAHTWDA